MAVRHPPAARLRSRELSKGGQDAGEVGECAGGNALRSASRATDDERNGSTRFIHLRLCPSHLTAETLSGNAAARAIIRGENDNGFVAKAEWLHLVDERRAREAAGVIPAEEKMVQYEKEQAEAEAAFLVMELGTRVEEVEASRARLDRLGEESRDHPINRGTTVCKRPQRKKTVSWGGMFGSCAFLRLKLNRGADRRVLTANQPRRSRFACPILRHAWVAG